MKKVLNATTLTIALMLAACGGGGGGGNATATASGTLTAQTISPLSVSALTVGSTETLTGTTSSGLPVTFVSTTPSTCTVSGTTLTGKAVGTCTVTATQSGNANYAAAPSITLPLQVILANQTITDFTIPNLSVGATALLNPVISSGLPITITSTTSSICSVHNLTVYAQAVGTCTLTASQAGDSQYFSAITQTASAVVAPANTALAANALLAPWMTTPQAGSITSDPNTVLEGMYTNNLGAQALIDGSNNFDYTDTIGAIYGSIQSTASTWSLNNTSIYYLDTSFSAQPATANGSFVAKNYILGYAQSFTTSTPYLTLGYAASNGYAASQSSIAARWFSDDGTNRFVIAIDPVGNITGTYTDTRGGFCALGGSIVLAEPTSQHNMYKVSLNASGASCTLETTSPLTGLAATRFFPAGANASNGYLPALLLMTQSSATGNRVPLLLFP